MGERPVVIVVGAGFSGLLTALHLLADPLGPQVRLMERRGVFARGAAYSTPNAEHLLNVRAENMSAFPDQPDHFVRWLASHGGWRAKGGFVTRGVYGDYLQSLMIEAVQGGYGPGRLLLEADEAVDIARSQGRWRVETGMGRAIAGDAIVLAQGALPPAPPRGAAPALLESDRYVTDPWDPTLGDRLGDHVLLLGSGLTMVDVAIANSRPGRRFTAISRRGLLPRTHAAGPPAPGRSDIVGGPLDVLRQVRGLGGDGRAAIDAVRGSAKALWAAWSPVQRRRFLRHLRPWWDVYRHRMAPSVAHHIEAMAEADAFTLHAGAIQRLSLGEEVVRAAWRPRGSTQLRPLRVDSVVNCTGHAGDLWQSGDRLLLNLLRAGLVRPDPCALGIDVDAASRPRDEGGGATRGLYAVGPITRGAFWEMTAVPDIRFQANDVARHLLAELGEDAAPALKSRGPARERAGSGVPRSEDRAG